MKTQQNAIRSEALTLAWQIVRKARMPFVSAQAKAWATVKLKAQMQVQPVSFTYIKDDGTIRTATGQYMSEGSAPLVIRYFDTPANAWRSFRADRLVIA